MQQPGNAARDDEPVSSGDAGDAGSVVSGGYGIMQVIPPSVDHERLGEAISEFARRRTDLTGIGQMVLENYRWRGHGVRVGIDPSTDAGVFTDRVTGATFPEDEGQTFSDRFTGEMATGRSASDGLYARAVADLYGIPAGALFTEADVARLYAQSCMTESELRRELGLAPDLDANEELIRSTRAEFAQDPHDYDMPLEDGMRWSPPSEGEETPSCPA